MLAVRQAEELPVPEPTPRTWLVLGDKRGDNGQVLMIAKALGWPCEHRNLRMLPPYVKGKPRVDRKSTV